MSDIVDELRSSLSAGYSELRNRAADEIERLRTALVELGVTPEEARAGVARHKATLARLEAAEKAVTEAYQRGYKTGQEEIGKDLEIERMRLAACGVAALGYFEGCAKEYQSASLADVIALRKRFESGEKERDDLRAKIELMERQEPVAWTTQLALELGSSALGFDACRGNLWGDKGVPLYAIPGAQPAPSVPVAYLDLGVAGYMDIGTDLTDEALAALPKGRHILGVIGTYGVDGYTPAQSAPKPEGE